MPGFQVDFADDISYNYCLDNFCAAYNFDGNKSEKEDFVRQSVIKFLLNTSQANYVRKKEEERRESAKLESEAILSVDKITIIPIAEAIL